MSLLDLLNRRRSVRHYDENQPIDADVVKECLRAAQLAPTSSNMQLYELYHVTDPATLNKLAAACMHQQAAKTAQQMVVFVTRQICTAAARKPRWSLSAATLSVTARLRSRKTASRIGKCTTPRLCRSCTRAALVCWAHPARQWRIVRAYSFR